MTARLTVAVLLMLAVIAVLAGCGASTQQNTGPGYGGRGGTRGMDNAAGYGGPQQARAAAQVTATETSFFGRKALRLANGLVTVLAVPELGGRIMQYSLGGYQVLYNNEAELGKEAGKRDPRIWLNFGGYKVWPAPQQQWGGPPDPPGSQLDGGVWTGSIVAPSGQVAAIQMLSPADPAVTGLQIKREVSLAAGSTRLYVKETFINCSNRTITWSIWDVTQVRGALQAGAKFSPEARIYLPLNPKSAHREGFIRLVGDDASQWKKIANGRVLEVIYGGKQGRIGADSDGGWIAYVDDLQGCTFAKTFRVVDGATYPDGASTVEVYTNAAPPAYMEMQVLSPLKKLEAGASFSFETSWYAARVGGPIVKVTDAAAIKEHPTLGKSGKDTLVTGELGVFAPGELALQYLDQDGKKLGASQPVKVQPTASVRLRVKANIPPGTSKALLVLNDTRGNKVDNVAEVPLPQSLAKAR